MDAPSSLPFGINFRSMGMKLIVVCTLALFITIPALFDLTAQGDWPSPGFDGGFLPVTRQLSAHGFTAEWSVPFIARSVRAEGPADAITGLEATALGVSFIEVADPYQSVTRSLKYVLLFLGLIFVSYFVFEVTTRKRVHPAQYVLVGLPRSLSICCCYPWPRESDST